MNWMWGIGNSTYIAFLMFVPVVGIIMIFVLGAKGNEWAWQNRIWRDVEHFKRVQKQWTVVGVSLTLLGVLFAAVLYFFINGIMKGEVFQKSFAEIKQNPQVIELLGSPIEASMFVTGAINENAQGGKAILMYALSGSKGKAMAYVVAHKHQNIWSFYQLFVVSADQTQRIELVNHDDSNSTFIPFGTLPDFLLEK